MTKHWAIIIDSENKLVDVGMGNNVEYYRSEGYTYMDVEQSADGRWYVKGYAPTHAIPSETELRIYELKQLLKDADYWGQKYLDGEYTEEEWSAKVAIRRAWREELRELSEKVE